MSSGAAVVTLPALTPRVRYHGVPRRYEETKPVVVRDLTHRKILDLGLDVHQQTLDQCAIEKDAAIAAAQAAVWEQAETIKVEALEKAQQKAAREQEKMVRKLTKAHEKTVRQETMRVASEMEKMAKEQVQQEREAGQKRLEEAVAATEARCLAEKLQAVAEARQEEMTKAAGIAEEVAKVEAEKLAATIKQLEMEKANALQVLEAKKEQERVQAVAEVKKAEQDTAASKLAHMQRTYEAKLAELRQEIADLREVIGSLQDNLTEVITHRKHIIEELMETRTEYQKFIDKTNPFEKGKSDYMIPPLRSVDLSTT